MIQQKAEILNLSHPSIKNRKKDIVDIIIKAIRRREIQASLNENEMHLLIDEALTNAMEHGNNWNPKKVINIKISVDHTFLHISISDEGHGFNSQDPSCFREVFQPRGRGLHIIKQFCEPSWNKKGNRIDLKIALNYH